METTLSEQSRSPVPITLVPGTQAGAESRHLGTVDPLPPKETCRSRCESAHYFPRKAQSRFTLAAKVQGFSGPRQDDTPPLPKSAEEWASVLKMAWRAQTTTIIAVARFFHAAKTGLSPGEWGRIWRLPKTQRPPRTKRTGDKYALVGQVFGTPNEKGPSHFNDRLPACVDALHALARLGRDWVFDNQAPLQMAEQNATNHSQQV